jgi:glutamate racemase
MIQEIVGEGIRVIDPAPAVAKQARRLLEAAGLLDASGETGELTFYTSGDRDSLRALLPRLLGESGDVQRVQWLDDSRLERRPITEEET